MPASGTESRAQINSAHTSLIHFISCRMKELCDELNVSDAAGNPKRFLLVCASGQTQIEVGKDLSLNDLMCAVVDPSANQPEHANPASAVLFVKAEQFGKQDLAYCQLIHDTRLLFVNQPNRRFMWGVTLSGTLARVVLFLDEHMLSSSDIDMITPAGRAAYIQFIVSLCHCERHQLGYDPSMTWCPENEYWIINCPGLAAAEDGERRVTRYYTRGSASGADRLFGRHTRGFMASADPARVDVPDTFIENAWPHMDRITQDMPCDELAAMLRIKQSVHAIGNSSCFDGFTLHVHRQVTLQTIGRPLSALSSPYELIIVLADAMVAHLDVLNQRNSPHRNISINNILAIEVGGRVRGMLTDFDCAAKVGGHHQACDEQTGLPPFMSINNLRNSSVERSELDDWESLLYVL
ncbi:hypothetical protein H4R23_004270 [Coemansia sp. Cherry 401B]|nr:hypothetical protein H4R23_004270 [Coemansia sp. Cherry 401B]